MKKIKIIFSFIVLLGMATGCSSVKAYQKSKINDSEMELNAKKAEKPESNFQSYSEGASGANGGKVGGGCGCN